MQRLRGGGLAGWLAGWLYERCGGVSKLQQVQWAKRQDTRQPLFKSPLLSSALRGHHTTEYSREERTQRQKIQKYRVTRSTKERWGYLQVKCVVLLLLARLLGVCACICVEERLEISFVDLTGGGVICPRISTN
ncbi:hypothetical protein DL98DRAFT_57947 [Cadophora sp. DSE1049]|nr:hypothetical protein DL98DRAFT_57947 [Cadophora sp. DSE1049]